MTHKEKFAAALARKTGQLAGAQGWVGKRLGILGNVAKFGLNHPVLSAGLVGGAIGSKMLYNDAFDSPTLSGAHVSANYDQQAIAADLLQEGGISPMRYIETAPQMTQRNARKQAELERSTQGLVFGLHRGRH